MTFRVISEGHTLLWWTGPRTQCCLGNTPRYCLDDFVGTVWMDRTRNWITDPYQKENSSSFCWSIFQCLWWQNELKRMAGQPWADCWNSKCIWGCWLLVCQNDLSCTLMTMYTSQMTWHAAKTTWNTVWNTDWCAVWSGLKSPLGQGTEDLQACTGGLLPFTQDQNFHVQVPVEYPV